MFDAKISPISLTANKSFLAKHLFNDSNDAKFSKAISSKKFRTNSLFWACQMYVNLLFCSSIIRVEVTLISSLSWSLIVVTIFILECCFLGQIFDQKVNFFKMSINGVRSGVWFFAQMQPNGDLENSWIEFDHEKWVASWTTMTCHVYDPRYCKVITITVCNMQFENIKAQ
jgi:hypothetical protein